MLRSGVSAQKKCVTDYDVLGFRRGHVSGSIHRTFKDATEKVMDKEVFYNEDSMSVSELLESWEHAYPCLKTHMSNASGASTGFASAVLPASVAPLVLLEFWTRISFGQLRRKKVWLLEAFDIDGFPMATAH